MKAETKEENADENVREWIKNKKSWIFYKDTIKKDLTVICERVDNDIYLLDCKSSKLHIWSGDMNTFLTISAKNLLQYEKGEGGCVEIYYKGIKLQTQPSMDKNMFIEYIDIKGDLARELLNLSRKGFTDKGNQYFEEVIYPGLQNSIQKVLKSLEKDEKKRINTIGEELQKEFDDLECKAKENELSEKSLEKFCQHILSAVVLIYIANCNELNFVTVYGKENRINTIIFEKLMQKLVAICKGIGHNENEEDGEYSAVLDSLKKYSTFFKVCIYGAESAFTKKEKTISLVDFFDSTKHFAIVQKREAVNDNWSSYLLQIQNSEIYTLLAEQIFMHEKEKNACKDIEEWAEKVINSVMKAKDNLDKDDDYKQRFLLNWLLKNIPTIAMFSDRSGNIRINVLGMKIFSYIYMNDNFKMIILRRMIEKYEENATERFSTIAWQNQECLICEKIPFSAFFVKRGKVSHKSYFKVIVPIKGKILYQMQEAVNNVLQSMTVKNIYMTLNALNMQEFLQSLVREDDKIMDELRDVQELNSTIATLQSRIQYGNSIFDIYESFYDAVNVKKMTWGDKNFEEISKLLECSQERITSWHKVYLIFAIVYFQRGETKKIEFFKNMINKLNVEQAYNEICVILGIFVSESWRNVIDKIAESELEKINYRDENRGRIIEFICMHAKYPIPRENIENCYGEFEKEIFRLFQKRVQAEIEPEVQRTLGIWKQVTRLR